MSKNKKNMKAKIILGLIVVSTFLIGCKNENKEVDPIGVIGEESLDQNELLFKVSLNVIVKKDDSFQLYYIDQSNTNFEEENSVWVNVKGSESPQLVEFLLPKDYVPSLIRLDFGLANDQEDIILSTIEMEYLGKKFTSSGLNMANYFRPLESTQIDFETGVIKTIIKDGKRVEPVLHPHESVLESEIIKLLN